MKRDAPQVSKEADAKKGYCNKHTKLQLFNLMLKQRKILMISNQPKSTVTIHMQTISKQDTLILDINHEMKNW